MSQSNEANEANEAMETDLAGVPQIGPVRRAALVAAGITSRTELAKASVEQIVGMTGMSRSAAQKVRAFLAAQMPDEPAEPAETPVVLGDEAMPEVVIAAADTTEPGDETDTELSDFDRAVFAAQTALADATQALSGPRLQKPFIRLAKRLEIITQKSGKMKAGRRNRIQKRLLALTTRLETASQTAQKLTPKRENKLRNRLQNESDALSGLLTPKKQPRTNMPALFNTSEKAGK